MRNEHVDSEPGGCDPHNIRITPFRLEHVTRCEADTLRLHGTCHVNYTRMTNRALHMI